MRERLGWKPGIFNPNLGRPTGMHRATYYRLLARHNTGAQIVHDGIERQMGAFRRTVDDLQARIPSIASGWSATKQKLRASVYIGGLDFKPWRAGGEGCFSVRVNRVFRAHPRFVTNSQTWIAEEIGAHGPMGHA